MKAPEGLTDTEPSAVEAGAEYTRVEFSADVEARLPVTVPEDGSTAPELTANPLVVVLAVADEGVAAIDGAAVASARQPTAPRLIRTRFILTRVKDIILRALPVRYFRLTPFLLPDLSRARVRHLAAVTDHRACRVKYRRLRGLRNS